MKTAKRDSLALSAYAVLAALVTYPLLFRFTSAIPGGGDAWQSYWNLWWVKRAFTEAHVRLFFTPDLYFPYGAYLYFHTLNLTSGILALPVTATLGLTAAYNFIVFLSFVFSGYGTYRLALYVRARPNPDLGPTEQNTMRLAAFVAGIIFEFSSYRYVQLTGHLDLVSTQWLPYFVLYLLKTRDEDSWRNVTIAAVFLSAAMLTSPYYMMFLMVFTALAILDLAARRGRESAPQVLRILAVVAAFAIIVSPVLVPMLLLGSTEGRTLNPAYDIDRFSTDALAFVVPSPLHPLWRDAVRPLYRSMMRPGSNIENVGFAGFVPLILGLTGLKRGGTILKFWLPLTVIFGALALGPVVHVAGQSILTQISFLMPYRLLSLLPYGDIQRVPARYVAMMMLCLAVIASSGAYLLLRRRSPTTQWIMTALITALAIAENAVVPLPVTMPHAPPFFSEVRQEPTRLGMLELPIPDDPAAYPQRMFYQTVHMKPIYGGYLSRGLPPFSFDALPGFAQFKTLSNDFDDVVVYKPTQLHAISRAVLDFYSMGLIVIEKRLMNSQAVEQARDIADGLLGQSARRYEDEEMLAYTVPPHEAPAPTAVWLDTGWSYLERLAQRGSDGRPLRWHWMGERARLGILPSDSNLVRLKFTAQAFGRRRRIQLALNGKEITTIAIDTDRADYETPQFLVPLDTRFIELNSLDGAESPGPDTRQLSIALFRMELVTDGAR